MPLLPPHLRWTGPGVKASLRGESTPVARGVTSGRIAPSRNLQNIKDEHADQPAKKKKTCETLPQPRVALLDLRRWKELILKKILYMQNVLCIVIERIM